MAQWSLWDLVSSRLGPDQRNFWKAVVMGKGVSEQGTSARAHHVTAACGWMGCSPRRVLPEGMLQDSNRRECRHVRVQMDHCSHGAQMHVATAKHRSRQASSFAQKQLKWSAGVKRLTCENIFWCRNSLLLPLAKLPLTPVKGSQHATSYGLLKQNQGQPKSATRKLTTALCCSRPQWIMQYPQPWKKTKNKFTGK